MLLRLVFVVVFLLSVSSQTKNCDRRRSRLVSKIVNEKLLPAFKELNTEVSSECLFSPERSVYHVQESHKSSEDNKWFCHLCGKSFYTEHFLDIHFENRHTDQLQEENSVCLADACEVFRCDVIGGDITPDFWDYALCLEDDMKTLHHKCSMLVDTCVPSGLTENETRWLKDTTMKELCSYLTCVKYWDIPFASTETSSTRGLYIFMSVMLLFGMAIYYFLFCAYYYSDTFAESIVYNPTPRVKQNIRPYQPDLRHRPPRPTQHASQSKA